MAQLPHAVQVADELRRNIELDLGANEWCVDLACGALRHCLTLIAQRSAVAPPVRLALTTLVALLREQSLKLQARMLGRL
jgi:hypothetical protein